MTELLLLPFVAWLQASPAQAPSASLAPDAAALAAAPTNEARFDALTALLKARGLAFTVEPFTIDKPVGKEPRTAGRNIVVSIGEGAETILVGAHYDAARLPDGSLSKGAVDNAASSVMLVRLAAALSAARVPQRVRIVWFDMEELGLIGSARYAQQHAAEKTRAMLNFDINAYGSTVIFGPSARPESAALRRTMIETCAAQGVDCVGLPQMPPGDDRSFVKSGIPTLSIAVLPAVEAHQVWLMMNGGGAALGQGVVPAILQTIHTPGDVPEKLDEAAMTQMLRFSEALVRAVAAR